MCECIYKKEECENLRDNKEYEIFLNVGDEFFIIFKETDFNHKETFNPISRNTGGLNSIIDRFASMLKD